MNKTYTKTKEKEPELRPECLWCAEYKNGECKPCRNKHMQSISQECHGKGTKEGIMR